MSASESKKFVITEEVIAKLEAKKKSLEAQIKKNLACKDQLYKTKLLFKIAEVIEESKRLLIISEIIWDIDEENQALGSKLKLFNYREVLHLLQMQVDFFEKLKS